MKSDKLVKKVIPSGNAGGVYVPKKWINQLVVVSLFSVKDYVLDALSPWMEEIEGVYLYGSHARGEACPESDINVLVVSQSGIPYKRMPGLNVEIFSPGELAEYAKENPVAYYSIAGEAVSLKADASGARLKDHGLDEAGITRYCADVRRGLKITQRLISEGDHAAAVYSLFIRLRGLYAVEKMPETYSHKGFEEYLFSKGVSREAFSRFHDIYRAKRDDRCTSTEAALGEVEALKSLTEKIHKGVEGIYLRRM